MSKETPLPQEAATSAPQLIHCAAGEPAHKYAEESCAGVCATCAARIEVGISTEEISNPTFSNHAEFFRFGTHVCRACAWLYGQGKGKPGSIIAAGERLYRPVTSPDSPNYSDERPDWLSLLKTLFTEDIPVSGLLTTDVKPRLWPRIRLASTGDFGLYVHDQTFDLSGYFGLDLGVLLQISALVEEALDLGFSRFYKSGKALLPGNVCTGLHQDTKRFLADPRRVMALEERLAEVRETAEFPVAVIVTYKRKERDGSAEDRGESGAGSYRAAVGAGETRGRALQGDPRLF